MAVSDSISSVFSFLFAPFKRSFWSLLKKNIKDFLGKLINLNITILTGTRSYFFGLVPSFSTICMLLIASAVLAIAPWMLATVAQSSSAYLASYVSVYAATIVGIGIYGLDSYWFDGPNKKAEFKGKPIPPGIKFGKGAEEGRPRLDLSRLVRHAHYLVLAGEYFQGLSDNEKQHILEQKNATVVTHDDLAEYMPFLISMDKKNPKFMIMGAGRYEAAGHLIFSAGCFEEKYKLTPNELTALTMLEIVKIRNRKTWTKAMITMCQNLLNSMAVLQDNYAIFKFLLPATFLGKIWGNAMERLIFKECLIEVARAGMGEALLSGLIKTECCTLSEKKGVPPTNQRPEYISGEHWYDFIKAPIYNYVRAHEGAEYKQHWLLALGDILKMEIGYFISRLDALKLTSSEIKTTLHQTMDEENLKNLHFALPEDVAYRKVNASVEESIECKHGYYSNPNDSTDKRYFTQLSDYKKRSDKDKHSSNAANDDLDRSVASRTRSHNRGLDA